MPDSPLQPAEQLTIETRIATCLDRRDLAQAATEALEGYGPQIFGFLTAILRDSDTANDAFSDFSEDLWRGIGSFRRECSFRTWAYALAWNAARQLLRDPFRRRSRRLETSQWSRIAARVRSSTARAGSRSEAVWPR